MANRVVLDENGLRVSKPGFNVLTTSQANLQFSSDWSALGFYRRGEINCDWSSPDWRVFSLGKSFASPPLVQFQKVESGKTVLMSSINAFYWFWEDFNDPSNFHFVEATVTSNNLRIKSSRLGNNPTFRLRYTILDYGT